MSVEPFSEDASTERTGSEVEYRLCGREMVRELESFLRAELAHPRKGRCISFLAARSDRSSDAQATADSEPVQGTKPW